MNQIITGKSIIKSFGEGGEKRNVLNGIDISITEGEFVSIMGPSGSGKTTLMFALSGMDGIDAGSVAFNGSELSSLKENDLADIRRTQMGFIFQQPTLLKSLNLLDNIILPAMRDNRKNTRKITQHAKVLMQKTGIVGLENRSTTQVSGGQLQRAGICRALLSQPKIIFGDEPTGALNSSSADEIMDILSMINSEGTVVLLVTHDAKVAARTDRILFMRDGKIINEMKQPKYTGAGIENRMEKVRQKMLEIGI